jgi:predicted amidophosphoribosyltransferase
MLRNFINALIDIVYPSTCITCRHRLRNRPSIDNLVCLDCWTKIKRNLPPFCHRCGRHWEISNPTKNICDECLKKSLYFDRAFSPCIYEGVIKELIHEFKYKGKDYLGVTLSRLMIEFVREYNLPMDGIDFIVPIPLHKTRLREREFNQRLLNVRDSFSVTKERNLKGKNILLVDDVLTTAATCSEAAYVLKNAGANSVLVLTLVN